ncbi:MAG: hypothetical protein RJA90_1220, partial [Bacteroidota bacterium]
RKTSPKRGIAVALVILISSILLLIYVIICKLWKLALIKDPEFTNKLKRIKAALTS